MKNKNLFPNWSISTVQLFTLFFALLIVSCDKDKNEVITSNPVDLCLVEINGNFEEIELDEAPQFLEGGNDGFFQSLLAEVSYPADARENGIEGLCVIEYEITEEGTVENIVAQQDPGGGIGDAVIGIIESITTGVSFSPGILNSNPVRVKKEAALNFKLED